MITPKLQEILLTKGEGKFAVVSLIQKRMRELVRGLPPLVETSNPDDFWVTVTKEILEGKVELVTGDRAIKMRKELAQRDADELKLVAFREKKAPAPEAASPAPEEEKPKETATT